MSPSASALDALRQEFRQEGFGMALYQEAKLVVLSRARRYPASIYVPTGVWDADALGGALDDWIVERLLGGGQLSYLLTTNETLAGFRGGLHFDFGQFLASRQRRSELTNLHSRVHQLLATDGRFSLIAPSKAKSHQVWGMATWEPGRAQTGTSPDALHRAAFAVSGITEVRYRPDAAKLSPVLEGPDLPHFLVGVLEAVGQPLTLGELLEALAIRFNLQPPSSVSLEGPTHADDDNAPLAPKARLSGDSGDYADGLVLDEVALDAIGKLSGRQRRILLERARGATYTTIATMVDCGKSTVETEWKAAVRLVAEQARASEVQYDVLSARILGHLSATA